MPRKVNPFTITDKELVLSPLKLQVICFDARDNSVECDGCKLACGTPCINILQSLTDALWCLINNNISSSTVQHLPQYCSREYSSFWHRLQILQIFLKRSFLQVGHGEPHVPSGHAELHNASAVHHNQKNLVEEPSLGPNLEGLQEGPTVGSCSKRMEHAHLDHQGPMHAAGKQEVLTGVWEHNADLVILGEA